MNPRSTPLQLLVGEWTLRVTFPGQPPVEGGDVVFEWLKDQNFLVQRWTVPVPEAPDGVAIIGFDEDRGTFLQHYFDSRGVARIYTMSIENGVWNLSRTEPDLSPLDFAQRYTGTLSDDGSIITGAWEIAHDGVTWEHDFQLDYIRVA